MRILHTADIHIGYETHGRFDPATGLNTRVQDFIHAFRTMIAESLAAGIDLVLFTGDAYRTADPTPTQQREFALALKPALDAGVPVVMIIGNHDNPVTFGKASSVEVFGYFTPPELMHIVHRPTRLDLTLKNGESIQLVCLPWPIRSVLMTRDEYRGLTAGEVTREIERRYGQFIREEAARIDPDQFAVLAGHLSVTDARFAGSEKTAMVGGDPTFMVSQLALPEFDYVALGHIHAHQNLNPNAQPSVVYPGSIERINFGEWKEPKGYVLLDLTKDETGHKRVDWRFHPTPARRFVEIEVDLRRALDPTAELIEAIRQHDLAASTVKVVYDIDDAQVPALNLRLVREALAGAHHIAAIQRAKRVIERPSRSSELTVSMSTRDALEAYLGVNRELLPMKEKLLAAALALEAELKQADKLGADETTE